MNKIQTVAVVGLGYVGLPLAVAFGRYFTTLGFDINEQKLARLRAGVDPTGEVESDSFQRAQGLSFTSDASHLQQADVVIVVVPTPIDDAKNPDLSALASACDLVGANLKPGAIVVFESTVYPGCTEEYCVPRLEAASGYRWGQRGASEASFHVGYSPERINPGDKAHRLESITKVVSGDCLATRDRLAELYGTVVTAGVYCASSIKVAESAKVIENTQRDLNIALMNELAMIFNRLDIDTAEVLAAAGTKWNFLPFTPGLVGGHCIGVDPYYLTHKAEAVGHHPQVILAGRKINDGMGKFIAEQTVKNLLRAGRDLTQAKVLILGLTFKEDCPDLRNSRVVDIVAELAEYRLSVSVHDPLAGSDEAQSEYGIALIPWEQLPQADALILAVPHRLYRTLQGAELAQLLKPGGLVVDVKSCLDRNELQQAGLSVWRL